MHASLDQGRCRAGMEVGRQENLNCVESEFPVSEHRIERLVRSGDTIAMPERLSSGQVLVTDRDQ